MPRSHLTLACLLVSILLSGCNGGEEDSEADLSSLLPPPSSSRHVAARSADSWAAAVAPRRFEFPNDHAAHPDYRIEWWYYTGNLESESGQEFGYQLTFFRTGIQKDPTNPSRWAVRDVYTAHFAISDIQQREHYSFQRVNRKGIGMADARIDRYEVWNGDWRVTSDGDQQILVAKDGNCAVNLALRPSKPLVLHGDNGLSRKGDSPGNASYYYSMPRLSTTGTLTIDEVTYRVQGDSWMDHEFSSSFLESGQVGWDWFAIQLDSQVEIMLYQMRREDGSIDACSSGTVVDQDGRSTLLSVADFTIQPLKTWRSSQTGAEYPLHWRIDLPELGYRLDVEPAFNQQEMATTSSTGIIYWEGSIDVTGRAMGKDVNGRGYLELTGYSGNSLGSLFNQEVSFD